MTNNNVMMRASALNPWQMKAVARYVGMLSSLSLNGVLGKKVIYPGIGVDHFPAMFVRVFGINDQNLKFPDPGTASELFGAMGPRRIVAGMNLHLINNVDARDASVVIRRLTSRGYRSAHGPGALFLKGFLEYLYRYEKREMNENVIDRLSRSAYLPTALQWVYKMIDFMKNGDHIILFDDDSEMAAYLISSGRVVEDKAMSMSTGSRRSSIVVGVKESVSRFLLIPGRCRTFEIKK